MKLKVKITGPKVHDVGYRFFLLKEALRLDIRGFYASNRGDGENQSVAVTIEGDEEQIRAFKRFTSLQKPDIADVTDMTFSDHHGSILRIYDYALMNDADFLVKHTPSLQCLEKMLDIVLRKLSEDEAALRRGWDGRRLLSGFRPCGRPSSLRPEL